MILMGGLRSVINALSGTESKAEQLREMQHALLLISRDVEQSVNRPVLTTTGNEEAAFLATARSFSFTHFAGANPDGLQAMSALARVRYFWDKDTLYKETWSVLDQAPETKPYLSQLLTNVDAVNFEYLDESGRFQNHWPVENTKQALPKAVKITVTIHNWGKLTQIYVISAQASKVANNPTTKTE